MGWQTPYMNMYVCFKLTKYIVLLLCFQLSYLCICIHVQAAMVLVYD